MLTHRITPSETGNKLKESKMSAASLSTNGYESATTSRG